VEAGAVLSPWRIDQEAVMTRQLFTGAIRRVVTGAFLLGVPAAVPAQPGMSAMDDSGTPRTTPERSGGKGPGTGMTRGTMGMIPCPMNGGMGMTSHGGMMGMMGGLGPFAMLDLSDEQRAKLRKLDDELRRKNWNIMGKEMDEAAKLQDLYAADKRDPKVIGAAYARMFEFKRQMIEATVETHNRMEALLTEKQREELKRTRRGMMGHGAHGAGPGMSGMPGGQRSTMGR
jgi:Spy/CpxP family protein refolding chaperone